MTEDVRRLLMPPLRDFLAERPEWEDEIKLAEIDGAPEVCMTMNCTLAFALWAKETGRADPQKAGTILKGLEDALNRRFGRG